ncbi:hypothetical protein AC249_AIPGENE6776 [Exaiptasia diaphana]|nr:hypothetical protein AC249_AIPGENE6776 [Exaiptasia diaphana]
MSVSCCSRKAGPVSQGIDQPSKQSKGKGKRVISKVDGYHEFEISDSQEPTQDDEAPARKRKASIASEAILV